MVHRFWQALQPIDPEVRKAVKGYKGNCSAAEQVGQMVAKRAIEKGLQSIGFDRSGYRFHGRVRSVAEAARSGGLQF